MDRMPLNLNLCEHIVSQAVITRAQAQDHWNLLDSEIAAVPEDAEFIELTIGAQRAGLVAHHSRSDGIGVWDLWTGDTYWSQLNRTGEPL